MTPTSFVFLAAVIVVLLLCCTVMGRWLLKRIAIVAAIVAVAAVFMLDGRSPL